MDVKTETYTTSDMKEGELKLDSLLRKRKKHNFKQPKVAAKRMKKNVSDEKPRHSMPIIGDIVPSSDGDEKKVRKMPKMNQPPHFPLQENTDTNVQYSLEGDGNSYKTGKKENGLSLISHNVLKSLDKTFFEEDTEEIQNLEIIKPDAENANISEAKKYVSIIPKDIKDSPLLKMNKTDCNLQEIEIAKEELGSDTSILSQKNIFNEHIITLNQNHEEQEKKNAEGGNEIDSATDLLNSADVIMCLKNKDKTTTLQKEDKFKETARKTGVQMEYDTYTEPSKHTKEKGITEFNIKETPTMDELNDNIEKANGIINDLLICKMNIEKESDKETDFQTSQILSISPPKDTENDTMPNSSDKNSDKINIFMGFVPENENCQSTNVVSQLKSSTVKENEHIEGDKITQVELEFKSILNKIIDDQNCKVDEKVNCTNADEICENFTKNNNTSIEICKTLKDEVKKQKPIFNVLSGIDTLDKNLKEKEKKLSILCLNALEYDKKIKKDDTEILDYGQKIARVESTAEQCKNETMKADVDIKSLKEKEKNLSILYMNALDYDKTFKSDETETLDNVKEMLSAGSSAKKHKNSKEDQTEILNNVNEILSAGSLTEKHKNSKEDVNSTLYIPIACDEERNLTKVSNNLEEKQGSTELNFLCEVDVKHLNVDNSKELYGEKIIKNLTNLEEKQDSTELNFLCEVDVKHLNVDNSEELYGEKIIKNLTIQQNVPEANNKAVDFKYENPNLSNLIYDKFSMKSIKRNLFQINSEHSSKKYISGTSSSFKTEFFEQHKILQDNKGISLKQTTDVLMHSNEQDKLPEISVTETKKEELKFQNKLLPDTEMMFLITARDCFKTEAVANMGSSTEVSSNVSCSDASIKKEEGKKENNLTPFYDAEDCFEMDDDFILTASQLSMIETDEKNQAKASTEMINSGQQTENCSSTHFGFDSITVEVINQLCYIRESVESIKELLQTALKKD